MIIDLYNGDCLEVMDNLIKKDIKVDAIITDPPYGKIKSKKCGWDTVIPFDEMWDLLKKLKKNDNTPILLFGSEPFSSYLRLSNLKEYKYDLYWEKSRPVGHLNANRRPLSNVETISVFYKKQCVYNPQFSVGKPNNHKNGYIPKQNKTNNIYNNFEQTPKIKTTKKYPKQTLYFKQLDPNNIVHPTQKPVKLMEYLINTYTNKGDLVLDFTMGSFTTAIACLNTKRNFIGIELDEQYFKVGSERLEKHLITLDYKPKIAYFYNK